MSIRGFLEDKDKRKIFYTLDGEEENNSELWIVCSPIFEEKVFTYSFIKNLADNLASKKNLVCRFDYLGEGDSDNSDAALSVNDWVGNIKNLISHIKCMRDVTKVNIVGLRLGANIAMEAAKECAFEKIVLLAPIDIGEKYINELLRFNLSTQLAAFRKVKYDRGSLKDSLLAGQSVNILGYELYERLFLDISKLSLREQLDNIKSKVSIIWFDKTDKISIPSRYLELSSKNPNLFLSSLKLVSFWHEPKYINVERAELIQKVTEAIDDLG